MPSNGLIGFACSSVPISTTGPTIHTAYMYLSMTNIVFIYIYIYDFFTEMVPSMQNMHIAREAPKKVFVQMSQESHDRIQVK